MSIFFELLKANLKELVRDRMAMFWFLMFPVLFIFLFGTIFSGAGTQTFNIGLVVTNESDVLQQQLTKALEGIPAFNVYTGTEEKEMEALENGDRALVVVLPKDISQPFQTGNPADVPIYYDATRQMTNQVLLPIIQQIFGEAERRITRRPTLFHPTPKPVQSEGLKDIDFLLPGILGMALMQLGLFGSLRLVSLREQKILKRIGVTPLPRITLIASEVVVRLLLAVVQTLLIVVIGQVVFGVEIIGSWWAVLGTVLLGAATFVSLGYMLVSFARTEEAGQGIIQVVQFPMMFLSGIFFPIDFMPSWLAPVVKALPLTYLGEALRQIMVGFSSGYDLTTSLLILTGWLVVSLTLAVKLFRWE